MRLQLAMRVRLSVPDAAPDSTVVRRAMGSVVARNHAVNPIRVLFLLY